MKRESGVPSTPRVAMYFFSNSPVRCLLTKVVYIHDSQYHCFSYKNKVEIKGKKFGNTFPVPPSPTRTSLKVGIMVLSSMLLSCLWTCYFLLSLVACRGWEWMGLVERLESG